MYWRPTIFCLSELTASVDNAAVKSALSAVSQSDVVGLGARDHVTEALIELHWLPVRHHITYKLRTLMHGVVYGYAPQYLTDMMVPVSQLAGRSHLCSAHKGAYDTPQISTTFGSRSFSYAAPHAWNQLPADIRLISTVSTFKQTLRHIFLTLHTFINFCLAYFVTFCFRFHTDVTVLLYLLCPLFI